MQIVILVYEGLAALDAIGPFEVFSRIPNTSVKIAAPDVGPVGTDDGFLQIVAQTSIFDVSSCDLLLVPGGRGKQKLMADSYFLDWLRAIEPKVAYLTSVCTGSIILGAAGLLKGRRATTHWAFMEQLSSFGAVAVKERVVVDERLVTAAGVSAGIDMALSLTASIGGEDLAKKIQLGIEYDPMPPFDAGSVDKAPKDIVDAVLRYMHPNTAEIG